MLNYMRGETNTGLFSMGIENENFFDSSRSTGNDADIINLPGRVEFGNITSEWVRLDEINRLAQTRQNYDPEALQELADSMLIQNENGILQFELIHDLTVAEFNDKEFENFLKDHEDFYDKEVDRSNLKRSEDGSWRIVIAGHRRSLAAELNCRNANVPTSEAFVKASIKNGISFEEALVLQLRENVHLRPPAIDEAKQIDRYFRLRSRREGSRPTIASCARILGFSESKVSEALRFAQLPAEVQKEASRGMISYGHAVELFSYNEVLRKYYSMKYKETYRVDPTRNLDDDVIAGLMALINKLKSDELKGANSKKKSEVIKANINNIAEAMSYHDGELFTMDEDVSPALKLRKAKAHLARTAMDVMIQTLTSGELTGADEKKLSELRSLLQNWDQKKKTVEEDSPIFELDAS